MNTMPLDYLDDLPRPMRRYIKYNGWHFNRAAYDFACSLMWKKSADGKKEKINQLSKEQIDTLLKENNITLENKGNYDYMYWAAQARADLMPGAIDDNQHLARYIKMMTDDADVSPETTFRKWYITMIGNGTAIPFDELTDDTL